MKTLSPSLYGIKDDTICIFLSEGQIDLPALTQEAAAYLGVDASALSPSAPPSMPAVVKVVFFDEETKATGKKPEPDVRSSVAPEVADEDKEPDSKPGTEAFPGASIAKAREGVKFYRDKNPPTPSFKKEKKDGGDVDVSAAASGYQDLFRKGKGR